MPLVGLREALAFKETRGSARPSRRVAEVAGAAFAFKDVAEVAAAAAAHDLHAPHTKRAVHFGPDGAFVAPVEGRPAAPAPCGERERAVNPNLAYTHAAPPLPQHATSPAATATARHSPAATRPHATAAATTRIVRPLCGSPGLELALSTVERKTAAAANKVAFAGLGVELIVLPCACALCALFAKYIVFLCVKLLLPLSLALRHRSGVGAGCRGGTSVPETSVTRIDPPHPKNL